MTVSVDVITGILECGKSTLIMDLLQSGCFEEYERIVLLQCEEGIVETDEILGEKQNVLLKTIESEEEINDTLFIEIKKRI